MLLLIDHLALRARHYEYLIRLFQEWEVGAAVPAARGCCRVSLRSVLRARACVRRACGWDRARVRACVPSVGGAGRTCASLLFSVAARKRANAGCRARLWDAPSRDLSPAAEPVGSGCADGARSTHSPCAPCVPGVVAEERPLWGPGSREFRRPHTRAAASAAGRETRCAGPAPAGEAPRPGACAQTGMQTRRPHGVALSHCVLKPRLLYVGAAAPRCAGLLSPLPHPGSSYSRPRRGVHHCVTLGVKTVKDQVRK